MKLIIDFLKRHSLVIGILLMFALTWPIDLANGGLLPFKVPFTLYLFLGWGFGVASVIMTGLTLGKAGVVALLKRYLQWRVELAGNPGTTPVLESVTASYLPQNTAPVVRSISVARRAAAT